MDINYSTAELITNVSLRIIVLIPPFLQHSAYSNTIGSLVQQLFLLAAIFVVRVTPRHPLYISRPRDPALPSTLSPYPTTALSLLQRLLKCSAHTNFSIPILPSKLFMPRLLSPCLICSFLQEEPESPHARRRIRAADYHREKLCKNAFNGNIMDKSKQT